MDYFLILLLHKDVVLDNKLVIVTNEQLIKEKIMKSLLLVACLLFSNSVFAFITVIDVEQKNGNIVTVDSADDIAFTDLLDVSLSYRGNAEEAVVLFQDIAANELPKGLTEYDFETNSTTGTISVIIKVQGTFGYSYNFFVIKRSGN